MPAGPKKAREPTPGGDSVGSTRSQRQGPQVSGSAKEFDLGLGIQALSSRVLEGCCRLFEGARGVFERVRRSSKVFEGV